jgi:hypothetical protein
MKRVFVIFTSDYSCDEYYKTGNAPKTLRAVTTKRKEAMEICNNLRDKYESVEYYFYDREKCYDYLLTLKPEQKLTCNIFDHLECLMCNQKPFC